MFIENKAQILEIAGWISVFFESWLLIGRRIPSDWLSWGLWTFFLIVAFLASAMGSRK